MSRSNPRELAVEGSAAGVDIDAENHRLLTKAFSPERAPVATSINSARQARPGFDRDLAAVVSYSLAVFCELSL
jgi:hypothetical protein